MTLTQLHYVITIAETKSFNKAAEKLYVSQPSLTSAMKELEKELGISIFYRNGRGAVLTNDGTEFLLYAKQIYGQYESVLEKYGKGGSYKKKFGVSTQHYSFAVKAFVDMAREFDMSKYEFAIRETRTGEVISDVNTMKSEIGVLYLCDFNRKSICGKIIRWQRNYPFVLNNWRNILVFPLNRETTAPFIWPEKFCPPMNIRR